MMEQRMKMGPIKAIVFDAFGTLFKFTRGGSARTIMKYITDLGIEVDEEAFLKEWKPFYVAHTVGYDTFMTEREIFTARNQMLYDRYSVDRDARADADELLSEASNRIAFPEVTSVLDELKNHYKVFIGSNTDDDVLESVMKKNNVSVGKIYTSENQRCYKPELRFYERIVADNDFLPEEFLFVGDTGNDDIIGPKTAGMKTAFVDREGAGTDCWQDYTIADLSELLTLLKK
ncbi:HAD family hydrolase [Butyrivibrio sp. VCD2006]|uniref:HAD family hydrolase n=1 Tax=Butyrivibrio sp. VCD2006 TaxID=1280664 RepID=UPI0004792B83|nr:HAD family hydrolase [Butyrivibrio sp. VCD2006]